MANMVMAAWVYPEGTVGGGGQCPLFVRSQVEGKAFMETFLSEACLLIMKNFSCWQESHCLGIKDRNENSTASSPPSEVQVREGTSLQLFQVPTSLQQTTLRPTPGSSCRHAGRTAAVSVQDKDRPSWRPKSLVLAVQGHLSLTSPRPRPEPRWTNLWVATAKKHTPVIYGSKPTYTQFTPLTVRGTRSPLGNGWARTLGWWEDVYSV